MRLFPRLCQRQLSRRPRHLRLDILETRTTPAVLTVNSPADTTSPGYLTLREAITDASADAAAGQSDTITFDASLTGLTITLTQGQLELTRGSGTVTIDGGGQIAVSGGGQSRVFLVDPGAQADLDNLIVKNGLALDGGIFVPDWPAPFRAVIAEGGGILNMGTLTISNSTISGNTAGRKMYDPRVPVAHNVSELYWPYVIVEVFGNPLQNIPQTPGNGFNYVPGNGGGIFNCAGGTLTVSNSHVSGNTAAFGWDGRHSGSGGGIFNDGTLTIENASTVSDNVTPQTDTTFTSFDMQFIADGSGGGVFNSASGTATIADSTITGNWSADDGGGIRNEGTMRVQNSTLSNNYSGGDGGAIKTFGGSLTMTNCTVYSNSASGDGGGVDVDPATAIIISSTFANNSALVGADLYNLDSTVTVIASSLTAVSTSGGTTTDPIQDLLAQITALNLNAGQKNSLSSKLQAAQQSLTRSNFNTAVNQLDTVINEIDALVLSHRLDQYSADALIGEVDDLIDVIA
jgi:hypothetical protein